MSENEQGRPEVVVAEESDVLPQLAGEVRRAQLAADKAELEKLANANRTRLMALHGAGFQVDAAAMMSMRIDILAEVALGEDSPLLTEYKLRVQRQLSDVLRRLAGEVRRAQMAAAANATPQQVEQMAKATGLLGPDGRPMRG